MGCATPGTAGAGRLEPDVVRATHATANSHARTLADLSVIGCSVSHGQVEVGRIQLRDGTARPIREDSDDLAAKLGRLENPTVEQHRGWRTDAPPVCREPAC